MKTKVTKPGNNIPAPKFYRHVNKFLLKSKGRSLTSHASDARPLEAGAGRPSVPGQSWLPALGNPKLVTLKPLLKTERNVSEVSQQKRLRNFKVKIKVLATSPHHTGVAHLKDKSAGEQEATTPILRGPDWNVGSSDLWSRKRPSFSSGKGEGSGRNKSREQSRPYNTPLPDRQGHAAVVPR